MRVFLTMPHDELVRRQPVASMEGQLESRRACGAGDKEMEDAVAGRRGGEAGGGAGSGDDQAAGAGGRGFTEGGGVRPWAGDGGLVSWHRVKLFADGSLGACGRFCFSL